MYSSRYPGGPRARRLDVAPLHVYLERTSGTFAGKDAVVQGSRRVAYGALRRDSARLASFLLRDDGDFKGNRVCLFLENSLEYVISYFGVLKAGGVVVPVGDRIGSRGARAILGNAAPTVAIVNDVARETILSLLPEFPFLRTIILAGPGRDGNAATPPVGPGGDGIGGRGVFRLDEILETSGEGAAPWPDVSPDDLAAIMYTSGTTGNPKGVTLSHRNLASNALSIVEYLALSPDDSVMAILPFYYSYGASLLTTHVIAGGSLVLENGFHYPNLVLAKMIAERVTGFAGVPSTFAILLNHSGVRKHRFPHLRYVTQAGGAMAPRHATELMEIFPGAEIVIMYGQTEASARLSYLAHGDLVRKIGSIGKAIPGVRLTVRKEDGSPAAPGEVGEIVAEGANVMRGYWGLPEETGKVLREDGLHTGDLATVDEEGYLYIVGRASDMIKSGAHRISAKEIEEVILEIPAVHEVAVVGGKDEVLGESIKACVVLRPGASCRRIDVLHYCRANLPPYKVPKHVVFCTALPKTATGKIRKNELAENGKGAARV